MPDFKQLLEKARAFITGLDLKYQIVIGTIIVLIIGALVAVGSISSEQGRVVLYKGLTSKDFANVSSKLEERGFNFTTSGTDTIYITPEKRNAILMYLAQEDAIPAGVKGWELFDKQEWTETQFEKEVKHQRALAGSLTQAIQTLRNVEKAKVNIAFPPEQLFEDKIQPTTAAVILHYAPGIDQLEKREIMGIETLVARSVPGLKKEDISIADADGKLLNDYDNAIDKEQWELKKIEKRIKIRKKEEAVLNAKLASGLEKFFTDDRYHISLGMRWRWDEISEESNEVGPVVMTPDDPRTPFSERVVKDSLTVSEKTTTEQFEGNGFTPEGPAGTEPNIPPGYKDRDYQKAKYKKTEDIKNNEFNKSHKKIEKQPYELEQVQLSIILDGRWEKLGEFEDPVKGWIYKRKYHSVPDDTKRDILDLMKSSIGFSIARGDKISVKEIQKDRSAQFAEEDAELARAKLIRKLLLGSLIALLVLAVSIAIFQAVKREIERRRRLREEELAAQQQMMREAALRAIEEEGVEVEMSLEERARKEMLENAIALAKERPDDVANLLRTWLAEE